MTVTTYQDHVPPTMIPTEGRGKVYLRFENLPKAASGPTLGPYPYVNVSFESVRVGPDKVEVARWHQGFWNLSNETLQVHLVKIHPRPHIFEDLRSTVSVGNKASHQSGCARFLEDGHGPFASDQRLVIRADDDPAWRRESRTSSADVTRIGPTAAAGSRRVCEVTQFWQ
jgi:hypothetical protein